MNSGEDHTTPDLAIDTIVHAPVRLAILRVLDGVEAADFKFLQTMLGLTQGNLSSHLYKLTDAGLIQVTKVVEGRISRTIQKITPKGRAALEHHWQQMEAIRNLSNMTIDQNGNPLIPPQTT